MIALVTGAAHGQGRATALALAREVHDVAALDVAKQLEHPGYRLGTTEELDSLRPDLDGNQIMALLGIGPSRDVGQAYQYLLERRMQDGPLGEDRATAELLAWWEHRQPAE